MINTLIFDFGKVLVDYDFDSYFAKYIPDEERRRTFASLLNTREFTERLDMELTPVEDIFGDMMRRHPEFEAETRIFMQHYPEVVTGEMPGMRDLLTRLKQEGYRLYGLSNWCSYVHTTMQQYPIFGLLDGAVISSEVHCIKPDARIYRLLLEKYGLKAKECVFADDRQDNIDGGMRVGIRGITFVNAEQYERALRQLL